jgi:hypothetical protein
MMMLIPEAWSDPLMDPERRAFYEYHAALMEPWDGPAAIAFTDGRQIGATLDRNGLRPARYIITDDDHVIMASEAGVLPVPEEKIVKKWRLQPGKMLLIDLEEGRIIGDDEIKRTLAAEHPYEQWLKETQWKLGDLPDPPEGAIPAVTNDPTTRLDLQQAFGYTQEDAQFFLEPMARDGDDPVGSMGTDTPIAAFSNRPKLLYNYFKQNFAQVTNPPIDPIREELVMSLISMIGPRPNLLSHEVGTHHRLEVAQPILTDGDSREDPQHRAPGRSTSRPTPGHHLAGRRKVPTASRRRSTAFAPRHRRGRSRPQHPDPVRPQRLGRALPDPGLLATSAGAPPPDPRGDRTNTGSSSRPARRAKCTISACWPGMAPRRSTHTSPSPPWSRSAPKTGCRCRPSRCKRIT